MGSVRIAFPSTSANTLACPSQVILLINNNNNQLINGSHKEENNFFLSKKNIDCTVIFKCIVQFLSSKRIV